MIRTCCFLDELRNYLTVASAKYLFVDIARANTGMDAGNGTTIEVNLANYIKQRWVKLYTLNDWIKLQLKYANIR